MSKRAVGGGLFRLTGHFGGRESKGLLVSGEKRIFTGQAGKNGDGEKAQEETEAFNRTANVKTAQKKPRHAGRRGVYGTNE